MKALFVLGLLIPLAGWSQDTAGVAAEKRCSSLLRKLTSQARPAQTKGLTEIIAASEHRACIEGYRMGVEDSLRKQKGSITQPIQIDGPGGMSVWHVGENGTLERHSGIAAETDSSAHADITHIQNITLYDGNRKTEFGVVIGGICSVCMSEGKKSSIRMDGIASCPAVGCFSNTPAYDEDGRAIPPTPCRITCTRTGHCSNGHTVSESF